MIDFLRKGNTYQILWQITDADGKIVTDDDLEIAQFMLGKINKYYPEDVIYSSDDSAFLLYLTQEETYALSDTLLRYQVRVKYKNGIVDADNINTMLTKNVLTRKIL